MIIPGLVSVTFRQLPPSEIIVLVKKAGLKAIEWGGDIHVPHGNITIAKEIGKQTRDAGLHTASYGSYFRLGKSRQEGLEFIRVLETAVALGTPLIRIWAGSCGSAEISRSEWEDIVCEAREIATAAEKENIKISMEFHAGTLADNAKSVIDFINESKAENIKTHWQPSGNMSYAERKGTLKSLLPYISCIHVFAWEKLADGTAVRRPLAAHTEEWQEYFSAVPKGEFPHYALLEFVKDNSPDSFLADAATLKKLLINTGQYNDSF